VYLAVEGVIGVGKTTLARLLAPAFNAEVLLEAFEENPFLSSFYADRARYAFQTQIFFLLSRYRQQQDARAVLQGGNLIGDYTFAKDRLFAHVILSSDELALYERLHEALAEHIARPDLLIYLRAETDTLMRRIAFRDRPYERGMDRDYIETLRQAYERFASTYDAGPVLTIDTDRLDFVRDPAQLAVIVERVKSALGIGTYQPALPLAGD
jgi:deoxyadenosine/deoxycytidine kinase